MSMMRRAKEHPPLLQSPSLQSPCCSLPRSVVAQAGAIFHLPGGPVTCVKAQAAAAIPKVSASTLSSGAAIAGAPSATGAPKAHYSSIQTSTKLVPWKWLGDMVQPLIFLLCTMMRFHHSTGTA